MHRHSCRNVSGTLKQIKSLCRTGFAQKEAGTLRTIMGIALSSRFLLAKKIPARTQMRTSAATIAIRIPAALSRLIPSGLTVLRLPYSAARFPVMRFFPYSDFPDVRLFPTPAPFLRDVRLTPASAGRFPDVRFFPASAS